MDSELIITESINRAKEGLYIRNLRKTMGLTQKDLSERVGLNQGNLCMMEKGKLNVGDWKAEIEEVFKEWRVGEISRLNARIKELNEMVY